MRVRRPTANAVRVSALVEATTSIGALSQKAARGFEPLIKSLQGTCLSHLATPPFKEQEPAGSTNRKLLALCALSVTILLMYSIYAIRLQEKKLDSYSFYAIPIMTTKTPRTVFMEVFWGHKGMIAEWSGDVLGIEAQAEFDNLLIELAATPRASWGMPDFKPLGGGIFEIRFKADGRQYRPLGYDGPGPHEFTVLVGAYKKMNRWTPPDARKTAVKRRKEIKNGVRKVRRYAEHLFTDV
jgi:hypothetical protein